ncbi:MAG TPA: aminotransferase class III-fold pyridoxal phosphate-dependent enzyme, partial [Vicinamibacterales bacterium]|nr:aminotransferase class III-fold pyridoxal phosphate-dependent enzyme [Vicinamibacterales bacterium]
GVLPLSDVAWKEAVGPLPAGFHLVPYPDPTRGLADAECLAQSLAALERAVLDTSGRLAAVIVEPIQGTAGNIVPPAGFLRHLRDVCTRAGALMIADEMITGFGRTGLLFGCNHDDVVPDIMTMGKGMASGFPVSAVLSTDEIVAAEPFSLPSASSSSYGGNPLAAAAALVTLQTIREERLVENSARVGTLLRDGLDALAARHPSIANVRGKGLLIGFDLVDCRSRAPLSKAGCVAFFKDCLSNGLILMGYTQRVRIHPPLILTADESDRALSILDRALERLEC